MEQKLMMMHAGEGIHSHNGQGSDVVDGGAGNDIIYLEADGMVSRFAAARFATNWMALSSLKKSRLREEDSLTLSMAMQISTPSF